MAAATPDATRAAIIAALLEGQGVTKVAKEYKVSAATVSRIKNGLGPETLQGTENEKRERIVDLIEAHLTESLRSCAEIAIHCRDKDWLSKQSAQEVGVLYGILSDKSIRILEAAEAGGPPDAGAEEEVG